MKKTAIILFALTFCSTAYAYDGWVGSTKILNVRFQPLFTLVQVENKANPGNCPSTDYFVFRNDNDYSNRYNSALLAAFAAGKRVKLAVTGCENTWPKITEVWIQ